MEHKEPIQQQPAGQAQPSYAKYREQTGSEEWQSGIFDCFTGADNLCLKATFCSCFVYGKTAHRTRDPSMTGYERINNDCLMFAAANCCYLGWVLAFLNRGEVRNKFNVRGDAVTDCLLTACCGCCSLIQVEKEVIGRSHGSSATTGYQAPAGMNAHPQ